MIRSIDAVLVARKVSVQRGVEGVGGDGIQQTSEARLVRRHHYHGHPIHPIHLVDIPADVLASVTAPRSRGYDGSQAEGDEKADDKRHQ